MTVENFCTGDRNAIQDRIKRLFQHSPKEVQKHPKGNGSATISQRYILEHVRQVTNSARLS